MTEEGVSLMLSYKAELERTIIGFSIAGLQREAAGPASAGAFGLWWPPF